MPNPPWPNLAKPRLRKAKAWRLLGEAKTTINDSQAPPDKIKQAHDTLDVANKLGLDDEQQAVYQQLREKSSLSQTGRFGQHAKAGGIAGGGRASLRARDAHGGGVGGGVHHGEPREMRTKVRRTRSIWIHFSSISTR